MGKKIQALKEVLSFQLPKIRMPEITDSVQLMILAVVWLIGGVVGYAVTALVLQSTIIAFVSLFVGELLFLWFLLASMEVSSGKRKEE